MWQAKKNTPIKDRHKDLSIRANFSLIQHAGEKTYDGLPIPELAKGHMERRTYFDVSALYFIEAGALKPWKSDNYKQVLLTKGAMEIVHTASEHFDARRKTHSSICRSPTLSSPTRNATTPLESNMPEPGPLPE